MERGAALEPKGLGRSSRSQEHRLKLGFKLESGGFMLSFPTETVRLPSQESPSRRNSQAPLPSSRVKVGEPDTRQVHGVPAFFS